VGLFFLLICGVQAVMGGAMWSGGGVGQIHFIHMTLS